MPHLLITKAFSYKLPKKDETLIKHYTYNENKGYWINAKTGVPMIADSTSHKPQTKKEDIETGEDRKGE